MVHEKSTIDHIDNVDRSHSLVEEDVKGRDFTVADTDLPPGYFRSFSFIGSIFAIGAAFGCAVGGFSLIAPVLAIINADVGPDPNIIWLALGYLLTTSIGLILVGRITDLFGRRWVFIFGNVIALLGAIVCATAHGVPQLIAGETLIGAGASVQLSYSFAVSELVPTKYRFIAQACIFLWGIPFSGLAAAVSYAFIYQTSAGWRGIYYMLIGLNGATTLLFFFCYHPPNFAMKHGTARQWEFIKHFDYIGTIVIILGLLLFLMGLSWGGTLYPWNSAHVIATLVVGAALIVAFVFYEMFANLKEPLMPIHLFKRRDWVVILVLWALGAAVYYANAILWPGMVATVYSEGHGTMWIGWVSCIPSCGILFGEYCGAWYRKKTHMQIRVAFIVGAIFLACMATSTTDSLVRSGIMIFIASSFIGWNEILCSTISTIVIDDQREIGTATGTAGSARSLISTICSTVFTTVLSNRLAKTIPAQVPGALVNAGLPAGSVASFLTAIASGSAAAFAKVSGLTPEIQAAGMAAYRKASVDAYNTVFLTTIAFSGIAIIFSIFAPNVDHLLNSNVAATLHERNTDTVVGARRKMEETNV
ncbi:MFS general substrate transporter [Microthyrium microscopicum]|uniref:MFS general substrate transporter n=1 Tax=Microthyrium microscopicum TaxID=703497 RepID=A0A6A6TYY3_9PEZI|nr:MFS general substrate transporter [Microthyrium microscopicum]